MVPPLVPPSGIAYVGNTRRPHFEQTAPSSGSRETIGREQRQRAFGGTGGMRRPDERCPFSLA
jgi:hypothetical protein